MPSSMVIVDVEFDFIIPLEVFFSYFLILILVVYLNVLQKLIDVALLDFIV